MIKQIRSLNAAHGLIESPPSVIARYAYLVRVAAIHKMRELIAFQNRKGLLPRHKRVDPRFLIGGSIDLRDKARKPRVRHHPIRFAHCRCDSGYDLNAGDFRHAARVKPAMGKAGV